MNPIRTIAQMKGVKLEQVAERLGITPQAFSSKLNNSGKFSMRVGFITEILQAMEVDFDQVNSSETIRYSVYVGGEVVNFKVSVDLDSALVNGMEG